VKDTSRPVITLKGAMVINWKRWCPYVDPGNTVTDNYYTGLVCTPDTSKVNYFLDGIYVVKFNITDPSGNKANEVIRYVQIFYSGGPVSCWPAGMKNPTSNVSFTLYPNPNHGVLNLELNPGNSPTTQILIFDANGKQIYSGEYLNANTKKIQIDLSDHDSGLYFIKVITQDGVASKVFLMEK
jgi:hypothetical protein